MKIASVVGARPQFIKVAAVSRELAARHTHFLIHTGQHYDFEMSEVFFQELGIPRPHCNLGVGSASHGRQTAEMLIGVEEALLELKPDLVLVYGDTNSTLAGALATAKLRLPLAHVEAGLRSFNRAMPEEINRVISDHLSSLLFCPTRTAVDNLGREGIKHGVHLVGDVMLDAVAEGLKLAESSSHILGRLGLSPGVYLLATIHRPDNTDGSVNLSSIISALSSAEEVVVFPAHPRTQEALKVSGCQLGANIRLLPPVSYLDMLVLEKNARLILTDSGGMQKEAYFFSVPCLTLRRETEWVETVEAGWNALVGADAPTISRMIREFRPPQAKPPLFGDGRASRRIADILEEAAQGWR